MEPKSHLTPNVSGLVAHGHPGDAGEVDEGQVWGVRGADLQVDQLVADVHSYPSNDILGYRRGNRRETD